jgi:hypothetical protein
MAAALTTQLLTIFRQAGVKLKRVVQMLGLSSLPRVLLDAISNRIASVCSRREVWIFSASSSAFGSMGSAGDGDCGGTEEVRGFTEDMGDDIGQGTGWF